MQSTKNTEVSLSETQTYVCRDSCVVLTDNDNVLVVTLAETPSTIRIADRPLK
jgi:hypothetical protein